jgi:hypothetical protein
MMSIMGELSSVNSRDAIRAFKASRVPIRQPVDLASLRAFASRVPVRCADAPSGAAL